MFRTRFAPSPTGYLHIGGVRTALFCYLLAKHHGGQFILRIDDTDQQRNLENALQPILHGFQWLGITWDEGPSLDSDSQIGACHGEFGPYYQSQRNALYQEAVEQLLASGDAYFDYATTEDIAAEREAAKKSGETFTYSRTWAATTDEEKAKFEAEGRQGVVRLKMPREGVCVVDDLVRGRVEFNWAGEQDHVIQRTDGSFIYHLASVVDDHKMEISHVIRAEEHLSNTPRQVFIFQALGWKVPKFAHLPVVAEPGSKVKLSKRKLAKYLKNQDFAKLVEHGNGIAEQIGLTIEPETFNPVIVDFYEQTGFLPEAVLNYLALLGWSLDGSSEIFSIEELVEHFSLERVNKAPSSFDPAKLLAFQERYFQQLPSERKVELVTPFLEKKGYTPPKNLDAILAALGDRVKVAGDILEFDEFFVADDALTFDEKAFNKRIKKPEDAAELLRGYAASIDSLDDYTAGPIETQMKSFLEEQGKGIGALIHAVRVATTGKAKGAGMFETLEILGKESVQRRIAKAIEAIG